MNFKSRMIEWSQKEKKQISFRIVDEIGSGFKKLYVVELIIDDLAVTQGQDYSIKGAEQLAAEKAWAKINALGSP